MGTAYAFTSGTLSFNGTIRVHASERAWVIIYDHEISENNSSNISFLNVDTNMFNQPSSSPFYRQFASYTIDFLAGVQNGNYGRIYFDIRNLHPTQDATLTVVSSTGTNDEFQSTVPQGYVRVPYAGGAGNLIRITDVGNYGAPNPFIIPANSVVRIHFGFEMVQIGDTPPSPGQGNMAVQSYQVSIQWSLIP
jgi:hypothetical protein